jgi:flagellar assembly protein FliH/type III secretion protein L
MSLAFGRVVSASEALSAELVTPALRSRTRPPEPLARIVPKPVVDAQARAAHIIAEAEALAARLLEQGRADLEILHEQVAAEARAAGSARLAAEFLALRALESSADERALDRITELARLLAERLLGEALALEPARVVALAEQALKEARGARRIRILAHPADVPLLEQALSHGHVGHVAQVVADAARARSSLRFETEIGTLDADVAPQLDRLAERLREALRHER